MKTIILKTIILAVLTVLSIAPVNSKELNSNPEKKNISNLVKKHITYPEVAQVENISGVVLVDLIVNEDGKLVINQINASDEIFKLHVERKIEELNKYSDYSGLVGQNLLYRFKFNLE